jgi:hypothetical protein
MRRFALILLAFGFLIFSHSADAQENLRTISKRPQTLFVTTATTPQTLTTRFPNNAIVQVTINDQKFWFFVDSGFPGLDINGRALARTGLKPTPKGALIADVSVDGLLAHDAVLTPMDEWAARQGEKVEGIVGSPLFVSNAVTVDYLHHVIVVYPNGSIATANLQAAALPVDIVDGMPIIKVRFGDKIARMVIATGYNRTLVLSDFLNGITTGPISERLGVAEVSPVGEPIPRRIASVRTMTIGRFAFPNMLVAVDDSLPHVFGKLDIDGVIGRDVLRAFRVTFDYPDSVIYLER